MTGPAGVGDERLDDETKVPQLLGVLHEGLASRLVDLETGQVEQGRRRLVHQGLGLRHPLPRPVQQELQSATGLAVLA